jgi:GntR family transcriptional regulator
MTIDRSGYDEPIWQQVARYLRERIDSGQIPERAPIPSKRQLTQELGVAPGTVEHAISVLKEEGLIKTIRGRGLYVVPVAERQPR